MSRGRNSIAYVAAAAAFICLLVYLRALSCGFVNWDDQDYVINNTGIRTLDSNFFVWAFATVPINFWMPLLWISYAIDYHFWGLNPLGYHLTNILLHAANTGLVVLIADRLCRNRFIDADTPSGQYYLYPGMLLLAGLLWGIHPMRVESVAWVTERKDVLNGLFILGSILSYLRYQQMKEAAREKGALVREYILSLVLFLLSIMAKPSGFVLPFMLLVMDWYPLGRLRKGRIIPVLAEKVPYLIISVVISVFTMLFNEQLGSFLSLSVFPLGARAILIGNGLFEYFKLMVIPVGILPYYHFPMGIHRIFIVKTIAAVCFLGYCIYWGRKKPWFIATLLSFIIPLLPVLGFFPNGFQPALCPRYTYLPSLGPCIVTAVLITKLYQNMARRWPTYGRLVVAGSIAFVLVFYVAMTQRLIDVWKDSGTMWSRVIAYQPFERAYFYRGLFYVDAGNYLAAVEDYTKCLTIATEETLPDIYNLYAFRGEALIKAGRYEDAVKDFSTAITIFPHQLYYYHRGMAMKGLGKAKEADEDYIRAGRAKGQMHWFSMGSSYY